MTPSQLLITTILLPLAGALLIGVSRQVHFARVTALAFSVAALITASILAMRFPGEGAEFFGAATWNWAQQVSWLDVRLSIGLDGLSIWLFFLSALLVPTCVLISWDAIQTGQKGFYALLLVLEAGMLGVFAARDLLLFYTFFEFTLIPLFFLIGIWGSEERRYAAGKFFLYTFAGSMLTFVGIVSLALWNSRQSDSGLLTFSIEEIRAGLEAAAAAGQGMSQSLQIALFLALFAGFAIKVPLFPFHTWLPLAHVQAPAAGSVLLAGVLLKMGTYGFLRFSIPMLPLATAILTPYIIWLSVAGILYGALAALAQQDIKKLIAYSSVSHLGFCMLGIFALNPLGVEGGTLQMINHGLSTGGLFACFGMLYERYHTRKISDLSGIAKRLPRLTFFFIVFTFASIGLPGLNGFAGEFLLLAGAFQRAFSGTGSAWAHSLQAASILALLGVVLGAWYMLWLVQRCFFGPLREPIVHDEAPPNDLNVRETVALVPLVVFVVWIGLVPEQFLAPMRSSVNLQTAAAAADWDASQGTTTAQIASLENKN